MSLKVSLKREITRMIGVLAGTTILALGLVLFLIPNKIAPGGVSGLESQKKPFAKPSGKPGRLLLA